MSNETPSEQPEALETLNWQKVRCFNIPVNAKMLEPGGFTRKLCCVLKSECPRHKPAKLRMITFDKDYVISQLNKTLNQLNLDKNGLGDLL